MKTSSILFGTLRGSAGNLTAGKWKGINYVKEKAQVVANPKTAPQQKQRAKFSFLIGLSRTLLSFIQQSFKEAAVKKTTSNAFVKANMPALSGMTDTTIVVSAPALTFSSGTLAPVASPAVTSTTASSANIEWEDNSNGNSALPTDIIHCVMYDQAAKKVQVSSDTQERNAGTYNFGFEVSTVNNNCKFYLIALRPSEGKASDSVIVN